MDLMVAIVAFLAGTAVGWLVSTYLALTEIQRLHGRIAELIAAIAEGERSERELRRQVAAFDGDGDGRIGGSRKHE